MVYLKNIEVYKEGEMFYRKGQKFKGKLRPTIIDGRRSFQSVRHPRYSYAAPKSPRKNFSDDFKAFKELRGSQEVYLRTMEKYSSEAAAGLVQVVMPVYKIDGDRIAKIYNTYRGWFPLSIFINEPIEYFPREDGTVTPGEIIKDVANIHGRDANMFVALRGFQVVQGIATQEDNGTASMTGAGHFIPNADNPGYDYVDNKLVVHQKDDRD